MVVVMVAQHAPLWLRNKHEAPLAKQPNIAVNAAFG
jgi:hypothetical protein